MKYYLDITLLPDSEISLGFIWYKVYQQTHLMLAEHKVGENDSAIALSFPQYWNKGLGSKLRLFAQTEEQLKALNVAKWFNRLEDYTHIKAIKSVPENVAQFAYFKRKQFKSPVKLLANVEERAQFLAIKNGVTVEAVKRNLIAAIDKYDPELKLPFLNVSSLSTNKNMKQQSSKKFKLFIERQLVDKPNNNEILFTCYGLSRREEAKQVAIPWFE